MQDLRNFTIFLHGPSGSGKGELQRKLVGQYSDQGYDVRYISSGDLYREAFARPEIAEAMKRGVYFDTLGAIIPGLQDKYREFVTEWQNSQGQTILLLDGLIRRGAFINKSGEAIPSQIEQIAAAFAEVRQSFPRFASADTTQLVEEIVKSKHLLIDINPRDAELQMRFRANKELANIRQQLNERINSGYFPFESTAMMYLLLDGLSNVINAEITTEVEFEEVSADVQRVRQELANSLGKNGNGSFANFFKELGVVSQLRDDDISPAARRKRIENYVTMEESEGKTAYTPGFAAQALVEGLGYQFRDDGSFVSIRENCLVVQNGQSKGIELQNFQRECEQISSTLYEKTEITREGVFGPEGKRRGKEK